MEVLQDRARQASKEIFLVAPFVKQRALEMLLESIPDGINLTLVTRWRVDEILSGVSDIQAFDVLMNRSHLNSTMLLFDSVHAKYFRFDHQVYIGSANLTLTGLGVCGDSIEILEASVAGPNQDLENLLISSSVRVDTQLREDFNFLLENSPPEIAAPTSGKSWFPTFRNPSQLWQAYSDADYMPSSRQAALKDLRLLGIPIGLQQREFEAALRLAVRQQPVIQDLLELLATPRRFGEVRRWLSTYEPAIDRTMGTQVLLRWVTVVLSDKVTSMARPYSEVIQLR